VYLSKWPGSATLIVISNTTEGYGPISSERSNTNKRRKKGDNPEEKPISRKKREKCKLKG
jgi:hypothetical protein